MLLEDANTVVGLLGPQQSGKSELKSFFRDLGWRFSNLNVIGDNIRGKDSPLRPEFDKLVPGCLYDTGVRKSSYYQAILKRPALLQTLLQLELDSIEPTAINLARYGIGRRIISWEYLPLLLPRLRLDHVLILVPQKKVWLERLRERALDREWSGNAPTDQQILEIIRAIGCMPEDMIRAVARSGISFEVVDTSASDFGAANIRKALDKL